MVNYVYADDSAPLLPAGTILHSIMWHDNSDSNRIQSRSGRPDYPRITNRRRNGKRLAQPTTTCRTKISRRKRKRAKRNNRLSPAHGEQHGDGEKRFESASDMGCGWAGARPFFYSPQACSA